VPASGPFLIITFVVPKFLILNQLTFSVKCIEIYNYKRAIFIFLSMLIVIYIVTLTSNNMPAGLYAVLKYISFNFAAHLPHCDTPLFGPLMTS
jgi:hypothetical protein